MIFRRIRKVADLGQAANVGLVPVHERPVGRQGHRADQRYLQGRSPHFPAEKVGDAGRGVAGGVARFLPLFGLRHGVAHPKRQERRQDADQENVARVLLLEHESSPASEQDSEIDAPLQCGRDPRPPGLRPGFREERCSHRPFASDAQSREKSENKQLPPRLSKRRKPSEGRVSQNGQAEGPAAAQQIADPPEEGAAQRPAHQKEAVDDCPMLRDDRIFGRKVHEQGDIRHRHQRVEMHVQPIEHPAKPGGDARSPLLR